MLDPWLIAHPFALIIIAAAILAAAIYEGRDRV